MYKAEDNWSWVAEHRPHGDTTDVDDDKRDLDNEEEWHVVDDKVCDDEPNDVNIWPCTDENLR